MTDRICDFNGLVLLYKPKGFSSAKLLNIAKKTFGVKKAGHCGTLDPMAEGLLICCLNQATRLSTFLLKGSKTYEAVLKLGAATDTQDATGAVTHEAMVPAFSRAELADAFASFTGVIEQIPPAFSALKHQGVPLYKLARKGKAVVKPARTITVEKLEITAVNLPDVSFTVKCSAGTYVRTLCHDLGLKLGCYGHMAELRRTETNGLCAADALTLDALRRLDHQMPVPAQGFIAMRKAMPQIPELVATPELAEKLSYGRSLYAEDFATLHDTPIAPNTIFCVADENGELLAIVEFVAWESPLRLCAVFCAKN